MTILFSSSLKREAPCLRKSTSIGTDASLKSGACRSFSRSAANSWVAAFKYHASKSGLASMLGSSAGLSDCSRASVTSPASFGEEELWESGDDTSSDTSSDTGEFEDVEATLSSMALAFSLTNGSSLTRHFRGGTGPSTRPSLLNESDELLRGRDEACVVACDAA